MIIPIRTDSRLRNTPYMNWALIIINVLVYAFFEHAVNIQGHWSLNMRAVNPQMMFRFELSSDLPVLKTFITYAFLHANFMHLAGNMLFLYIFGNNVNDKMGHLGYLAFYLAGGVAAGIAYVLLDSGGMPVIGASGAIAAVTGGYLVLFPRSSITVFYMFWVFGSYDVPSLYFIAFFFVKDVFLNFAPQDAGVAHVAHIGGTIFGFAICLSMLALGLLPRDQFDLVAAMKQWNRRRQYREMVSKGYNPFEYGTAKRAPTGPPVIDPKQEKIMTLRAAILDAIAKHDVASASPPFLELLQLDPQQVLPKQAQLDLANQLAGEQRYTQASAAYETYLRVYPKAEHPEQINLMLGLIYARYLAQPEPARRHLEQALLHLHDQPTIDLAREELAKLVSAGNPTL